MPTADGHNGSQEKTYAYQDNLDEVRNRPSDSDLVTHDTPTLGTNSRPRKRSMPRCRPVIDMMGAAAEVFTTACSWMKS